MTVLHKEKCDSCLKFICLEKSITECSKCSTSVIHTKCYKKSNFEQVNRKFYCWSCFKNIENRYNPFHDMGSLADEDSDNFNTLTEELNCFKDKFSLISLTETNLDFCHKDL